MIRGLPPRDVLDALALQATTEGEAAGLDLKGDALGYFNRWRDLIREAGYGPSDAELHRALPGVTGRMEAATKQNEAARAINAILPRIRDARDQIVGLDEDDPADVDRVERLLGGLLADISEVNRLSKPYPELESRADVSLARDLGEVYRSLREKCVEEERADRIARHAAERPPDVQPTGTICASCGHRPARVDDLCKRCAHAAGVMPHGKIGAA